MQSTATFIEVNGVYGLTLLVFPIVLTAIALLGLLLYRDRQAIRLAMLWGPTIVIGGFSFVAIFSIGLLYLPAAVALVVAALADLAHRPEDA